LEHEVIFGDGNAQSDYKEERHKHKI